ncbi:MAG: DUF1957 domain-containing protein [Nitrospirae bacterium]|nr:DUF1957 domain-containing protein [Nitrospirota bacterium]
MDRKDRHLHKMAERIGLLSGRLSCEKIRGTPLKEAVNQLIREMLLAQASDWFFLIEKERASEYAGKRVAGHIRNFNHVFSMITGNDIQDVKLDEMKRCNTIFPWLDAGG